MTEFYHIVISRFSIRMNTDLAFRGRSKEWLFDVNRLEQKLRLFEYVALSSVVSAEEKPDLYLVLIDPMLPSSIRTKLEFVISNFPWIELKEVEPGGLLKMTDIGELLGLLRPSHSFIVTTNLDDDDALGKDYLKNLRSQVRSMIRANPRLPFHWFGSIDMYEWDIIPENDAPGGYIKPYSGGVPFILSTGYSVLSMNHPRGPNVFTLSHSRCLDFLTVQHRRKNRDRKGRLKFRLRLAKRALEMGKLFDALNILLAANYATRLDYGRKGDFEGLIINHGDNLQTGRLHSGKTQRSVLEEGVLEKQFNTNTKGVLSHQLPKAQP